MYGCGASSPGPQEPLLPTIEGQSEFSDRFQLEEEPQSFYDLYGKELLEGNKSSAEICGKEPPEDNKTTVDIFPKYCQSFRGFFTALSVQRGICIVNRLRRCPCVSVYPLASSLSYCEPLYLRDLIRKDVYFVFL